MFSHLQSTSVNNLPPQYTRHANRSHDAWKWASESSLILTHTLLLIDSLFVLEVRRDVRYSFAVRKGMSSLWCLVPVPVSAGTALTLHFPHQTRPLEWYLAVTHCSSAVRKHKPSRREGGKPFPYRSVWFQVWIKMKLGEVCTCQRLWPFPLIEQLLNGTFIFSTDVSGMQGELLFAGNVVRGTWTMHENKIF